MTHTKRQWESREGTTSGKEVVAEKPRGGFYIVARCGEKDRDANASLISAAPDLLDVLRAAGDADSSNEDIRTAWWEARAAAIAKATT